MKSLKKTLSLVLVLVMVLGMFGIASAAKFTDDATVQYKEAVDVMVGIGAIAGFPDGTFGPTKTITRAEAAKMVAYAVLGKSVAESLTGVSSSFKDVPASPAYSWAIPSIEYLVSVGAIAGDGQGNFNPTNNVTALELGKMLLVCLGIEGNFTGSGWDLQVGIAAQKAGLFEGRVAGANALDKAASREETALYCFNALFFSPTGASTEQIWTIIGINGGVVEYGWVDVPTVAKDSIAAGVYPTLTTTPAFIGGVSGYYWYYKSAPISGFIGDATVLATSAYGIPWAALTTATSTYYIKYQADTAVTYYYNDIPVSATWPTTQAINNNITDVQGYVARAGVIVNFIDTDNDNKYDVVSVTEKTVAQLSAAPTTKTTGSVTTVTIPSTSVNNADVRAVVYPTDLVKGDVVLYYTGANGVAYVERATKLEGNVITSYVNDANVTIGGVKHAISGLTGKPASYDDMDKLEALIGQPGYSFFVDNGGNICYVIAPDTSAVLTNTIFVPAVTSEGGFSTTYKAIAVKPDGTQSIITVAKIDNGAGMVAVSSVTSSNAQSSTPGQLGGMTFYTFTLNTDGSYNLTKQTSTIYATDLTTGGAGIDAGDTSFTITANKANFLGKVTATAATWSGLTPAAESIMAHAGTVFMYYDATANTYTSVTGIANAKSYAAGGTIFVLPGAGGFASIVIATGSAPTTATSSYDQVFVTSAASVSIDGNGVYTYSYSAVINGEADKTITSYVTLTAGTLYFINDYANGVAKSAATTLSGATAHTGVSGVAYAGGTFIVTGTPPSAYILNANAKIFVYDISDGSAVQINADQAAALTYATDKLTVVQASATDTSIIAVYITVA